MIDLKNKKEGKRTITDMFEMCYLCPGMLHEFEIDKKIRNLVVENIQIQNRATEKQFSEVVQLRDKFAQFEIVFNANDRFVN